VVAVVKAVARLVLMTIVLVLAGTGVASAHPLGNFTVNHLTVVRVSGDHVELRYILDRAEIPTFQLRGESRTQQLADLRAEVGRDLRVTVDGRPAPLRVAPGGTMALRPGQGGLPISRFELRATAARDGGAGRVELRDDTYAQRLGLRAIVAAPGEGTAVRSSVPAGDPTDRLRVYPKSYAGNPPDQRAASFAVRTGEGTLSAPHAPGGGSVNVGNVSGASGFAGVFENAAAGKGVLAFLLLAAFAWGGFHALSPGHGKAMVAAYLVGARGTTRDAILLGAIVTLTHTVGVFALGLITLLLAQYILPETLYPWLTLLSGLMVVVIGAGVLRSRIRLSRAGRARQQGHGGHDHAHAHAHGHDHDHDHDYDHAHGHGHSHLPPERLTGRNLVAMGASAGLIPCPSALVVLLGAVAQHQVALGLLLIVVFSFGLAATLTVLGLIVVHARRFSSRMNTGGRLITALPSVSALVIVAAGCALTAQAVPKIL
jgi:nickel/cobalt exporter